MPKEQTVAPVSRDIEMWPIADLAPYARNTRTHSAKQVEQIAGSMRRFGFTIPVLAREDGTIIAGHGRVMAAERIGIDEVPVIVARGWTEEQCRQYTIADNRLAETSEWDLDALRIEIEDLGLRDDVDALSDIGFDPDELSTLLPDVDLPDGEAPPEWSANPPGVLSEKFGLPPMTVLDARSAWWMQRKRAWISLGIRSEIGRGTPVVQEVENA